MVLFVRIGGLPVVLALAVSSVRIHRSSGVIVRQGHRILDQAH